MMTDPSTTGPHYTLWEFAAGLTWADVPAEVQRRLAWLTLDLAVVSAAGGGLPSVAMAADYADRVHAGSEATALYDGRKLAAAGAAFANGVLANALDFDDGHRITKGHPGAIVIPGTLAAAESRDSSSEEFLLAVLVAYEIAIRAGIELHARSPEYHASGAWGALGAAVGCACLFGLNSAGMAQAVNIAEYHAPIADMSRAVTDPAMTKDATGWGAFLGVSAALLAESGFTGLGSRGLEALDLGSLGHVWAILDVYVKPYPCCRWSQPAVDAALAIRGRIGARDIKTVEIRTFGAASRLSTRRPSTSEEIQYSLVWPVAVALFSGRFGANEATAISIEPEVERLVGSSDVVVDPALDAAFPARRLSQLIVRTADGSVITSGVVEAQGEPDGDDWEQVIAEKADRHLGISARVVASPRPPAGHLGGRTVDQLVDVLSFGLKQ